MFYYLVWVRSNRYHSKEPLTYSHADKLPVGSIVQVSLQKLSVIGFVASLTTVPRFKTKPINFVYNLPPLNINLLRLARWLIDYYPAPLGLVSQQFLPAQLPTELAKPIGSISKGVSRILKQPELTEEQKSALEAINKTDTYLLHGKTGSGKTRIYTELAQKTLDSNRSVIVLTPEISLTSQLYNSFNDLFKDKVVLIHSRQTPKERRLAWLKCLTSKEPLVVIGPRSAIFSPLSNHGLIIIDEAHETAYKQDQLPHYQTIRVASTLASLSKSTLIIGTATPNIADYYVATEKHKPILKLNKLAKSSTSSKTDITVVDIKDKSKFSSSRIISNPLIESIKKSLDNNEQSLLYLNRRGTSRLIFCDNCGWEALCGNCNLPLTYHGDLHQLRCHSCGYKENNIPSICPSCDNDSIIYRTVGTKAIVDEISRIFVNAKISRFDTDNLKADSIEQNYSAIRDGKVDIIVGTQLLAKGFDLPKLSTVGILQADTSLYLPDFSSQERTFQLITQVIGRVNRGHVDGRAIIQTYSPSSKLLKAATDQNYDSFYESELKERKDFRFPPFYYLFKLSCRRSSPKNAEAAAAKLKDQLLSLNLSVQVEGPTPAFYEKQQGKYQWQLVVKTTKRNLLIDIIRQLPANWSYDIDPINLL
jgi:primosomal protein N' (replication factor Y)